VCAVLCTAVCGCGGSQGRVWRGPRIRSTGESIYAPPVEPPPEIMAEPMYQQDVAPPIRPGDLEPVPTPAIKLEQELPPPPPEEQEAVQFLIPVQPSPMPNALSPAESKPVLEQSSAVRPLRRDSSGEVLGDGKIAMRMKGHSTFPRQTNTNAPARLMHIEADEDASPGLMQVQYVPMLAPVPAR
ncbi:MAG TPA: hypothetical protein VM510_10345, partial [Caulifigura sp.]|nr:hypothetical protein [Caulifigura sp.]